MDLKIKGKNVYVEHYENNNLYVEVMDVKLSDILFNIDLPDILDQYDFDDIFDYLHFKDLQALLILVRDYE